MGRYKSLGSLKSFLWYAFQWSRASILFFPILNPLRYTIGSACSGWWQPVFLCFVFPQDSPPGAAVVADGLMTPTFFVYWYGRWFFVHLFFFFFKFWRRLPPPDALPAAAGRRRWMGTGEAAKPLVAPAPPRPSLKTELQSLTSSAESKQLCTRGDKENPQEHGNLEACQKGISVRSPGCSFSPELIYTALLQAVG